MHRLLSCITASLTLALSTPRETAAQDAPPAATRAVRFLVRHDGEPLAGVVLRRLATDDSAAAAAQAQRTDARDLATVSDERGHAELRLGIGRHGIVATRIGFAPETVLVTVEGQVTSDAPIVIAMEELAEELEAVVVASTRTGRRVEDEPVRVEVLPREEIEEKLLMTPGDITMMLNETSGLRVQSTSPSLGGANVRVQGLRGRYTQVLSDGLPLYGGQAGALGLLQIPPMDLGQVEVIKGAASALYGASALGGVVNLISRRPERARELLLNQTSRGGTDVVGYLADSVARGWAYSALAGAHRQAARDVDGDGWADLAGYERGVLRPRAFWSDGAGASAFLTVGATLEDRTGGTLRGRTAPDGEAFIEGLRTSRLDAGAVARAVRGNRLFAVRGSVTHQAHRHRYGSVRERDRHLTSFGEASWTNAGSVVTTVLGAAVQQDAYRAHDVEGFDYTFTVPGLFAQVEYSSVEWLALSMSARADHHSEYGGSVSPRVSALLRGGGWTLRSSAGGGVFGPTPFTEETEVVGLAQVVPPRDLRVERAWGASVDVGRLIGALELNATAFASTIDHAVVAREASDGRIELLNAPVPTRTHGTELLARYRREPVAVTASYVLMRSTEFDAARGERRAAPLTPRHTASLVAFLEEHDVGRAGVELYFTGPQLVDENPYRRRTPAYLIVGLLAERRFGPARVFVNGENLLGVRQTEHDPLLLPTRGAGGRWTTDVWAPLEGRTVNGGVRLTF